MNRDQLVAALRALAILRLSQDRELRARCLGVAAVEIAELSPAELRLAGIESEVPA